MLTRGTKHRQRSRFSPVRYDYRSPLNRLIGIQAGTRDQKMDLHGWPLYLWSSRAGARGAGFCSLKKNETS